MQQSPAQIFGLSDCRRAYQLRDFFQRCGISFRWYPTHSTAEACRLAGVNRGEHGSLPLLRVNGHVLSDPLPGEVVQALGWTEGSVEDDCDLAIIGAGPAGLSAAVTAASEGLRTIVVERYTVGGQAGSSSRIENYLGFPEGISGWELAKRMRAQAERFGARFLVADSLIGPFSPGSLMLGSGRKLRMRAIVLATGVEYRRLNLPREEVFLDRGFFYGAGSSEAGFCSGSVAVIGGGNSAAQAALHFSSFACDVSLIVRGDSLKTTLSQYLIDEISKTPNIKVHLNSSATGLFGGHALRGLEIRDESTGLETVLPVGRVFVCIGGSPRSPWALESGIATDSSGYLYTGTSISEECSALYPAGREPLALETSVPGIFAAGDVRHGSVKRCATAIGEGATAVSMIHQVLQKTSAVSRLSAVSTRLPVV